MYLSNQLQLKAKQRHHLCEWDELNNNAHKFSLLRGDDELLMKFAWHPKGSGEELFLAYSSELSVVEQAYLEGFCELASTLSWSKLSVLGSRELENYLRDDNHTPAHDPDHALDIGQWIEVLRDKIFSAWLSARLSSHIASLKQHESALELTQWLNDIDVKVWGERAPKAILSSLPANLVPLERKDSYEIQWRFVDEVDVFVASSLCMAVENSMSVAGISVKVVAES